MDKNKGKNKYLDKIGVQGRKTGITLSQNVERDELGFQDIDSAFANIVEPSKVVADEEEDHDYDITSYSPPPVPAPASNYVRSAIQKVKDWQKKTNIQPIIEEKDQRTEFLDFKRTHLSFCPDSRPQPKKSLSNIEFIDLCLQTERYKDIGYDYFEMLKEEEQGKLNTELEVDNSISSAKTGKNTQRKIKLRPKRFSIEEDGNSPVLIKPKIKPIVVKASVKSKKGLFRKMKEDSEQFEKDIKHNDISRIFTTPDIQFDCKPFALNTPLKNKPKTAVDSFVVEDMDLLDPKRSFVDREYSPIFKADENQVIQPAAGDLSANICVGSQGAKGIVNRFSIKVKNTSAKQKTVENPDRVKADFNEVVQSQNLEKANRPTELQVFKKGKPKGVKFGKSIISKINDDEAQINLSADKVDATSNSIDLIPTESNIRGEAKTKRGAKANVKPVEKMPSLTQETNTINQAKAKDVGLSEVPQIPQSVDQPGRKSQRSRTKPKRYWELETTACMYSDLENDVKQEPKRARKSAPKPPKTVAKSKPKKETADLELASEVQVQAAQRMKRAHENGISDSRQVEVKDSEEDVQARRLLGPKSKRKKSTVVQTSHTLVSNSAEPTGQNKSTAPVCSADLAPQSVSIVPRIIPFPPQNNIVRKGLWFTYEKHLGGKLVTGSLHLDPNQDEPLPEECYRSKWIFTVIKGRTEVLVNHLGNKLIQQGDVFLCDAGTTVHWFNRFEEDCLLGYTKVSGI